MPSLPAVVFLNGQFTTPDRAFVSVNDRGFFFGDGVYEALRTYNGQIFALDRHVARLRRSLSELAIPAPPELDDIESLLKEGMARGGFEETLIYLQITRGVAPRAHVIPDGMKPSIFISFREYKHHADACYEKGVSAITLPDERWGRCDIKTLCLLPNTLAKTKAHDAGAYEAILFGEDGAVHEGSSCNAAIVRDGVVSTHPATTRILWGVTRDVVLELARANDVPVREETYTVDELKSADEVMIWGTTYEVMPVVKVDDAVIGGGEPGPMTLRLLELLRSYAGVPTQILA